MKPLNIFFILIIYLSASFPATAAPAFLKTAPRQTHLSDANHTPNRMLFVHNDRDYSLSLRKNLPTGRMADEGKLKKPITAEESVYLAYLDTFYYRIDPWARMFRKKIYFLEHDSQSLETQLDLMKYYFNLGGLNVELSHIMGFNSKYKIREIQNDALFKCSSGKRDG